MNCSKVSAVILAGVFCLPTAAAIGDLRAVERSNTQISIEYLAPDSGPCRVEISESASYSPLVHDVDGTLFTGANLDTRPGAYQAGRERVFIAGTRTVAAASDGKYYSRALQQLTRHYIRVGCGAGFTDQATITATTGYPTFSRSVRDPFIAGPDHLTLPPDFSLTDRNEVVIEPFTGAKIKHFGMPGDALRIFNDISFTSCSNLASGWTLGGCDGTSATATTFISSSCTVSCGWLALTYYATYQGFLNEAEESNNPSINHEKLHFTGQCSGANISTADCTAQVCWSWDGGTCAGPAIDLLIPTSSGPVSICAKDGTANCVIGDLWGADYRGIFHSQLGTGYIYTTGTSSTLKFTDVSDCGLRRVGEVLGVTDAGLSQQSLTVASLNCGGSPPSVVLTSPFNLDPSSFTGSPGFPFSYRDAWYLNPRWSLLVRKKSLTANNTLSIVSPRFDLVLGGVSSNTSAGYNEPCSQYVDSNGFRKCRMTTKIYAYNQTTGEVRFLGQTFGRGFNGIIGGEQCQQVGDGSTFWIDANSYYCAAPQVIDGKPRIWKVTFTGDTANDVEKLPNLAANEETSFVAGATYADMTNGSLLDAIHTFDNAFVASGFTTVGICGFSGGRYLHFFLERGSQDTLAWAAVYDIGNGLPIGAGGNGSVIAAWQTYATPSGTRWSVNHACFWIAPEDGAPAAANLAGMDLKQGRDDVPNGPRYHFTLSQNLTAATTAFNISSTTPVAAQPPTTLQAMIAGDVFICNGDSGEAMQIVSVNSTTNITVTRGFGSTAATSHTNGEDCALKPYFNKGNINQDDSGEFWDFLAEPHGPTSANLHMSFCPGGGHAFYYSKWVAGSPPLAGNYIAAGVENTPGAFPLCFPSSFRQDQSEPVFSNVAYGPQSSGGHEGHPGFKPTPYPLALDNHPNIGEGQQLDTGLTRVGSSGTLFRLTYNENPFGASPHADGLSLKYLPHVGTSQTRLFTDISGPGSSITGAIGDAFKYCIVLLANECVSGSSAGQIYINSAYINPAYYINAFGTFCWLGPGVIDDTCFTDQSQRGEAVVGYILPSTGATIVNPNLSFPVLYQFAMWPKGLPNTSNTKLLWGNWGYGVSFGKGRPITYLVKLPDIPPPFDSANRTAFFPETIQIPSVPAGTSDVIVDFGYAEYGATTDFYCTQRREKCLAVHATINSSDPFKYPTEGTGAVESGVSGVPCSVSCTVTVPVIPGYTVYFQIRYRNASHATLWTQQAAPRIVSNPSGSFQVR